MVDDARFPSRFRLDDADADDASAISTSVMLAPTEAPALSSATEDSLTTASDAAATVARADMGVCGIRRDDLRDSSGGATKPELPWRPALWLPPRLGLALETIRLLPWVRLASAE